MYSFTQFIHYSSTETIQLNYVLHCPSFVRPDQFSECNGGSWLGISRLFVCSVDSLFDQSQYEGVARLGMHLLIHRIDWDRSSRKTQNVVQCTYLFISFVRHNPLHSVLDSVITISEIRVGIVTTSHWQGVEQSSYTQLSGKR